MKHILLTGGPTNEYIDEVMKITNMSTGSLTLSLAETALRKGDQVTAVLTNSVLLTENFAKISDDPNFKVIPIETTQEMYDALKAESQNHYDVVIHASAVGDYKPEFTFRMEELADKLAEYVYHRESDLKNIDVYYNSDRRDEYIKKISSEILDIMEAGDYKVDNSSKISSYEPNLTVKLTLTTKIIANLRSWFTDATLIGCKLLENVTKDHLIEVATNLCKKNDMDYIMANDLAMLRDGQPVRFLCTKDGYTGIELNGEGPALLDYAAEEWF